MEITPVHLSSDYVLRSLKDVKLSSRSLPSHSYLTISQAQSYRSPLARVWSFGSRLWVPGAWQVGRLEKSKFRNEALGNRGWKNTFGPLLSPMHSMTVVRSLIRFLYCHQFLHKLVKPRKRRKYSLSLYLCSSRFIKLVL